MRPDKTLVVCASESTEVSAQPLPIRTDWYPGALVCSGLPTPGDIEAFLDGVDVVYTAETGYGPHLWNIANSRGVKTFLHANFEFLNRADQPTQWLAPSPWRLDEWPAGTIHIPVPIESGRFPEVPDLPDLPTRLIHVVGRPTLDRTIDLHRNGTIDLLRSLQHVTAPAILTVRCQKSGYVENLIAANHICIPDNIDLRVISGDTPNYWDNYENQHALILPRRFGGLCLPAQEAVAAGIPAIMTNIDPNDTWLPKDWLVAAPQTGAFMAKQFIDVHTADPIALALKIQQLLTDPGFYRSSKRRAMRLRYRLSWAALEPFYRQTLQ